MEYSVKCPRFILSDENIELTKKLNLPTFEIENMILTKRVTLICKDGEILKFFYQVFPPDKNVDEVISWIEKS
jgi:peroxiredoxin